MTLRLWYPQLDVYDCVRRMSALLNQAENSIHPERLFILDFYLANPPLLHKTTMKLDMRAEFRLLKIPKPEKSFVAFPAAQLLFHQMEPIQRNGLGAMAGKGLVSIGDLKKRMVKLTDEGRSVYSISISQKITDAEAATVNFLIRSFGKSGAEGLRALRASTRLRRAR